MQTLSLCLKNKRATVWGAGREGVAARDFLEKRGVSVTTVTDPLTAPLTGVVVKSPGVSLYRPEIEAAVKNGAVFTSGTNLFFETCLSLPRRPRLIGVTGTKGKSTTSSLIAHLMTAAGRKTVLAGNIGRPLLTCVDDLPEADVVVDEMSSYQAADFAYAFDVCVVVNLYPEHVDWHGTHERYYRDKLNILAHRTKGQKAVLNGACPRLKQYCPALENAVYYNTAETVHIENDAFYDGEKRLFSTNCVPLAGRHNLENVCAALTALKEEKVDLSVCEDALKTFRPLPHRLQTVAVKNGVTFVDDSISTTPETTMAALDAFKGRHVVLIAGGYDRKQDYTELAAFIAKRGGVSVVCVPTTGARLAAALSAVGVDAVLAENMKDAVDSAKQNAKDVVLLSPAAPSYDFYKSFEERGEKFAAVI